MKRVLVIDDDKMIQESAAFQLRKEGFEVITADDGHQALDLVDRYRIDVIVCDIIMPKMSGLGLISLLKNFYLNRIPVIMISSMDKGDVVLSAIDMGADYFMAKPLDYEELVTKVKELCEKNAV